MTHLSLYELTGLIKSSLEKNLEPSYWVVAEISEMRLNQKGHCYMEIVEKEGQYVSAKIRANIWAFNYRRVSSNFLKVTQSPIRPGIKLRFNVVVNFHEVYGMSLTINDIDPNFTLGERAKKRQEVIDRLSNEGLIAQNKAISLPLVPQRIAVVSSDTAAGYGDFMEQLNNNKRGFQFRPQLFQALLQGDEAAQSMMNALREIRKHASEYDMVAIIRGGGAQADFDCFDDYELCKAIARFPIPILTGIGHERDETIADMVAHTKLKTPTAVAEFLIGGLDHFDDRLNEAAYRIERSLTNLMRLENLKLQSFSNKLQLKSQSSLNLANEKLNALKLSLKFTSLEMVKGNQLKLERLPVPLKRVAANRLTVLNNQLETLSKEVELLDPKTILKRGYTISRVEGVLLHKAQPKAGDQLETTTATQTISSEITNIE